MKKAKMVTKEDFTTAKKALSLKQKLMRGSFVIGCLVLIPVAIIAPNNNDKPAEKKFDTKVNAKLGSTSLEKLQKNNTWKIVPYVKRKKITEAGTYRYVIFHNKPDKNGQSITRSKEFTIK